MARAWLPDVYESPAICASVSADGAAATGLIEATPIVAGAGDNAAAAVGGGIVNGQTALVSVGTSGVDQLPPALKARTRIVHVESIRPYRPLLEFLLSPVLGFSIKAS